MKRYLAAFALLATPSYAAGEKCIAIDSEVDRLACYDNELGRTPVTETLPTESKWRVDQKISKLTDQTDVYLYLESEEPASCNWSRGEKVTLVLRCKEGQTTVIFSTGCHMTSGIGDYGVVEYRLDKEAASKIKMTESTDNKALGLWDGRDPHRFIQWMMGHKSMVVRMTPYGDNPLLSTFEIAGLDEAVKPLRKACGW